MQTEFLDVAQNEEGGFGVSVLAYGFRLLILDQVLIHFLLELG